MLVNYSHPVTTYSGDTFMPGTPPLEEVTWAWIETPPMAWLIHHWQHFWFGRAERCQWLPCKVCAEIEALEEFLRVVDVELERTKVEPLPPGTVLY